MDVTYVRDSQFRDLVSAEEANDVIEEVFVHLADEKVLTRPTVALPLPKSAPLRIKAGADYASGVYGFKSYRGGGRYLVVLYDLETLDLTAMVEGRQLTELRTGAVSAVGTKYMARDDSSVFGIIGTGREARQQLLSTMLVRDFSRVLCYSRSAENRERFAREMTERTGIEVLAASTGEECVCDADVVTTITASSDPVLMGAWLREGTHINAVGATSPNQRELDEEVIARCGTIAVELKEGAVHEVGELIHAAEQGKFSWDGVVELKDIVSGAVPGRVSPEEITLNDTVGVGAEDVALAWFAVKKARKAGISTEFEFEPHYNVRR